MIDKVPTICDWCNLIIAADQIEELDDHVFHKQVCVEEYKLFLRNRQERQDERQKRDDNES